MEIDNRPTDAKDRTIVYEMTEREMLEETVLMMRETQDIVKAFIADFSNNPMLGMFGKMMGKKN